MRRAAAAAPLLLATLWVAIPWLALSPLASAQLGSLTALDREISDTVERVAKAVVRIGPGFSGICVHERGFVLTDSNVQRWLERQGRGQEQGPTTVDVTFPNQSTYPAKVVEVDLATATAMLEIQARKRFPSVRPGNPSALEVGHFLLTIGNSFGSASESKPSVTCGVLSSIRRDDRGRPQLLETSASTNRGQEGGPYFNVDGDLVGLEKSLPDGQDLAILTPIDRILAAYAEGGGRYFDKPRAVSPPRSKTQILSKAFGIAAARARKGVCTLLITRSEPEEEAKEEAVEAAADTPGEEEEGRGKGKGKGKDKGEPKEKPEEPLVPPRKGPVTGTLIDDKGFLLAPLTAFDDTVETIEALLHDGRRFRASLISRDRKAGLALLLLDKPPQESLSLLPELEPYALRIGQFVLAIGAPHGPPAAPDPFVTIGILSATGQLDPYKNALQTDAAINVKNAGGALVDLRGRLLGIILPPTAPFGQNSGLGFCMPIADVRATLPRLMQGQDVEPAYIGVVLSDTGDRSGIRINEVQPGHAAEAAGIEMDDVITHLDGVRVLERRDLSDFLWKNKSPGDPLRVQLRRGDESLQLTVTLGRRPGS